MSKWNLDEAGVDALLEAICTDIAAFEKVTGAKLRALRGTKKPGDTYGAPDKWDFEVEIDDGE